MAYFLMTILMLVGFLLMFIILLQRGRGGGLAGAFGGAGGQSALGTRAGDVFTRITIVLAVIWVLLAAGSGPVLRSIASEYNDSEPDKPAVSKTKKDGETSDAPSAKGSKKSSLDTEKVEEPDGTAPDTKKSGSKKEGSGTKEPDDKTTDDKKTEPETKSDSTKSGAKKDEKSDSRDAKDE